MTSFCLIACDLSQRLILNLMRKGLVHTYSELDLVTLLGEESNTNQSNQIIPDGLSYCKTF